MTAKPGPWAVYEVDCPVQGIWWAIENEDTADVLHLITGHRTITESRERAERIAARLNATEGDER